MAPVVCERHAESSARGASTTDGKKLGHRCVMGARRYNLCAASPPGPIRDWPVFVPAQDKSSYDVSWCPGMVWTRMSLSGV